MKYLYIVLFLFASPWAYSQKILIGPVGSTSYARAFYDEKEIAQSNIAQWTFGGGGGISATFVANSSFGLSTELLYYIQNKSIKGIDNFSYFKESYSYIKSPILFQYALPVGHSKINAQIGPSVNYWISGKGKALVPELVEGELENGIDYNIKYSDKLEDNQFVVSDPNRWQLGIQVGTGIIMPMHRNYLKFDARFEWGHTNMAKTNSTYSPFVFYDITLDHTFHSFSLTCAYLFSFDLFELSHKGKSNSKKEK